jgi:hypothetical protein
VYSAIASDVVPEPRRPFNGSICALVLWIIMWINVFIAVASFIGWTYSNPRMGFYAFNGSAPLVVPRSADRYSEGWSSAVIDYSKSQSAGTCNTVECVRAATMIIQNMSRNRSVDPCEDFEEMACGRWRDRHGYRLGQGSILTGTLMEEQAQLKLRHVLEAGYPKDSGVLCPPFCGIIADLPSIQSTPRRVSPRLRNRWTSRTLTK